MDLTPHCVNNWREALGVVKGARKFCATENFVYACCCGEVGRTHSEEGAEIAMMSCFHLKIHWSKQEAWMTGAACLD